MCDNSSKNKTKKLNNHIQSNHEAQSYNNCKKRFISFRDVLEHNQKEHQTTGVQNDNSFVFSESIQDKYDNKRSQAGMVTADELVSAFGELWGMLANIDLYLIDK